MRERSLVRSFKKLLPEAFQRKQVDNSKDVLVSSLPWGLQSQGLEKKAAKVNYNGKLQILLSRHPNIKTYMSTSAFLLTNMMLRNV